MDKIEAVAGVRNAATTSALSLEGIGHFAVAKRPVDAAAEGGGDHVRVGVRGGMSWTGWRSSAGQRRLCARRGHRGAAAVGIAFISISIA